MGTSNESNEIDFGPLAALIGTWKGNKGKDVSPKPDGPVESQYSETLIFEPVGDVTNAQRQTLVAVRYLQLVQRQPEDTPFHNEMGYWIWDADAQTVMHSLIVPRAVCVLAGGKFDGTGDPSEGITLEVKARMDDPDWGIVQSPFMRDQARTVEFRHKIQVDGDKLSYHETTVVEIYGKTFDHTDENELTRC